MKFRDDERNMTMSETPPPSSPVLSVERLPSAVVVHVLARDLGKSEVDALCGDVDKAQAAAPWPRWCASAALISPSSS